MFEFLSPAHAHIVSQIPASPSETVDASPSPWQLQRDVPRDSNNSERQNL